MDPTDPVSGRSGLDHDSWWHEDDLLHQAEGVISVQLAVSIDESAALLRAHSETTGIPLDAVAARIVRHDLFLTGHGRAPDDPEPSPPD
jgi:hypothetical protein